MPNVTMKAGTCSLRDEQPVHDAAKKSGCHACRETDRNTDVLRGELEFRDVLRRPRQRDRDLRRNDRRQDQDRTDGEVDPSGDDDERHADR